MSRIVIHSDPDDWDGDESATVPAWWFLPESGRFDDLPAFCRVSATAPADRPPAPQPPPRRRSRKPASNQSNLFNTTEEPSDGKYDDNRKQSKRR